MVTSTCRMLLYWFFFLVEGVGGRNGHTYLSHVVVLVEGVGGWNGHTYLSHVVVLVEGVGGWNGLDDANKVLDGVQLVVNDGLMKSATTSLNNYWVASI